ncbi:hypothetical protein U1Q18_009137 [Sarracenia purpurea var. burkii]
MESAEVKLKFVEFWDQGFEHFRQQARAIFLDLGFNMINLKDDDASTLVGSPRVDDIGDEVGDDAWTEDSEDPSFF